MDAETRQWRAGARSRLGLAILTGGTALAVVLLVTNVLHPVELISVDARFALRGDQSAQRDKLLLVAVDASTLDHTHFPVPRGLYGRAIARLHHDGAEVVVLDVQITAPADPAQDDDLIDALHRNPGTIMVTTEVSPHGGTRILGSAANRAYARVTAASTELPEDDGGTLRRFEADQRGLATLPLAAAAAAGHPVSRGVHYPQWIDYSGGPGHHAHVSLESLLRGRVPASAVKGRIVVIGATAPSLQDVHSYTSIGSGEMSGPEIELNALATALRGQPLRSVPGWIGAVVTLLLCAVVPAALVARRPLGAALGLVGAALALCVAAELAFRAGWILPVAAPLAGLAVAGATTITADYTLELAQRAERLRLARVRAVETADAARRSVERDLHDGAQQRLLALAMLLSDPDPDRELTQRAVEQVMQTLAELRALARGVYPEVLTRDGLMAALEVLAREAPLPVRVDAGAGAGSRAAAQAEQALYFVATEGLTNVIKHAAATQVVLGLTRAGDTLQLEVRDDGRGGADASASGLLALADRVEAAGGRLEVRSQPGTGTRVLARVPAGAAEAPLRTARSRGTASSS